MIQFNPAADQYFQNTGAHIVDGPLIDDGDGSDYGFAYIAATDTIHFAYDAEPTGNLTAEQHYYLQAFTVLGLWAENQMDVESKDKNIQRFNCKLAALHLCNRLGILKEQYGMNPQAKQIVQFLDKLQP